MLKKGLVLVAVLGFVGAASAAEINLFWSATGISDAGLMYSTALTNFTPAFVPDPVAVTTLNEGSYDVFLWGQFPSDWTNYQIYGLDLRFHGTATHDQSVAYRQRIGATKRWDGSNGILLDGVMAAVTSGGIVDTESALVQADGKFLIGAVQVTITLGQTFTAALDTPPGLGIACRNADGEEIPDPTVIPATLMIWPEPASALLVLAVALSRRRGA